MKGNNILSDKAILLLLIPLLLALACVVISFLLSSGCFVPPGVMVDGYAAANVETWEDLDGDGERDPEEPPLPWVKFDYDSMTDSHGQGTWGRFKPGCACRCWEDETIYVEVPYGYRATTPIGVGLTGNHLTYAFGFQRDESIELPSFPGEPDWYKAFLYERFDLVDFHYEKNESCIYLSFNDMGKSEIGFYETIFETFHEIPLYGSGYPSGLYIGADTDADIYNIKIYVVSTGDTVLCDMRRTGRYTSPQTILASYCEQEQPKPFIPSSNRRE